MTFKKHDCNLDLGSDSMLPKCKTRWGNLWRSVRKLGQLSMHHPNTPGYFRSYSAVVAERQRQILEEGNRVIHPLSLFSIFWTALMIVVNVSHTCIAPFRLFFVLEPLGTLGVVVEDRCLLVLQLVCLADIVMRFNMGYCDKQHFPTIVLDRKSIAFRYLRTWMLLDLVSSVPLAYTLLHLGYNSPRGILVAHILPLFRITRICTVIADMKTISKLFSYSYIIRGTIRIPVVMLTSAHWSACLMYLPPVVIYYWTGQMPVQYNYYLQKLGGSNLLFHTIGVRYGKAMVIVVSAFIGTGFSYFRSNLPDELLIHSFIIVYAAMFKVFTLAFLIKAYLTLYDSTTRYNALTNQVEEYMKYRQFPVALQKRMRTFYAYKYQKYYFMEDSNLNYLSEELRDEIKLHTSRSLVYKVKLFENIPASTVGTVLGCIRSEVYLANDLVLAAGDIGDCMYFMATGTVAVYSLKGVEICHLEDGAHFGEVALLMKDSKRVATVVAVEICTLYRLDAEDFRRYILTHPMLYERIEALATKRMHETVLVDDAFREERRNNLLRSSE